MNPTGSFNLLFIVIDAIIAEFHFYLSVLFFNYIY